MVADAGRVRLYFITVLFHYGAVLVIMALGTAITVRCDYCVFCYFLVTLFSIAMQYYPFIWPAVW